MTPRVPGVYREDVLPTTEPVFRTGVPAFLAPLPAGEPRQLASAAHLAALREQLAGSHVIGAVSGFFSAGGKLCYLVPFQGGAAALDAALAQVDTLDDVDLLAAPDQPEGEHALRDMHVQLLAAGDGRPRLCLLDAPARVQQATAGHVEAVSRYVESLVGRPGADNAAIYFPWVIAGGKAVPPCGHVAGVISATDERVGVHKAPANELVRGVVDLDVAVTPALQRELAHLPLNCICAFTGRGIRIWGARTLSDVSTRRSIHVRRLLHTIRRYLEARMDGFNFEPNDSWLWGRIAREVSVYLQSLYEKGALRGARPDEAYSVRCDETTNPPEVRDAGIVHADIGVAPSASHEFIVLRLRVSPQAKVATLDETTA